MAAYISFQPRDHYSTKIYTGTGSSLGVTGVGFQPDFTWIKNPSEADFHVLTDSVRGVTKYLQTNSTAIPVTNAESLKSFDSDGFTVGTMNEVNTNTEDCVSWNWKAGTTTGITTTGSTITPSSYSFNTTSGFSLIAYTGNNTAGALVPHGLGVVPKMIIIKRLNSTNDWMVYHEAIGNTDYLVLNDPAAKQTATNRWNDTSPTSTLFSLGTSDRVNGSSDTYIAYCFADVKGFSKMGFYPSNGSLNGPFIHTGFRPSFVMCKITDASDGWAMMDMKRAGYNNYNYRIRAQQTAAQHTALPGYIDILSNGFKCRSTDQEINSLTPGKIYIYIAFAEFPTVSSNDIPTVAR